MPDADRMPSGPHHERILAPSPFPGDDGAADPSARQALADAAREPGPTAYLRAVAALCVTRVLVPVVATATRTATSGDGLTSDKQADMAVVMLEAADGRRSRPLAWARVGARAVAALGARCGLEVVERWDGGGRTVVVLGRPLDASSRAS